MNNMRRKIWNLIRGGSFHGYLRTSSGYPLTLTGCMPEYPVSLSVSGNTVQDKTSAVTYGVGDRTENLFDSSNGKITSLNYDIFLEKGTYSLSYKSNNPSSKVYLRKGQVASGYFKICVGDVLCTVFSFDNDDYLRFSSFEEGLELSEIMLIKGEYTSDTMPPYEPYGYKVPLRFSGRNLFDISCIGNTSNIIRNEDKLLLNGYACGTTLSPSRFLKLTGLQPGDTITTSRDFSIKNGSGNSATGRVSFNRTDGGTNWMLINAVNACTTSVVPSDFNNDNYSCIYFYGANKADESGKMLVEMRNIQILKGSYTADTMPPYEPYHESVAYPIYLDAPLYGNGDVSDTVELDVENKKATLAQRISISDIGEITQLATPVTTDISSMQDWDSIPKLWSGTAILTADTTVLPSGLTVEYYADKPEEVN